MKLLNHQKAVVPEKKLVEYLLSSTHRDGRYKAAFFKNFGFTAENWEELASALLKHAATHEIAKVEDSSFGKRFVIEGILKAADGRTPHLRSVWFVETETDVPRFVTAYPPRSKTDD